MQGWRALALICMRGNNRKVFYFIKEIIVNLDFYNEVGRLKRMPRTGWVQREIPNPETVAEHMYRSQFIVYDFAKATKEDPQSCVVMMMLHDLQETRAGDITPHCGISKAEKAAREFKAAQELAELSGNPEFFKVFREYEGRKTKRAQLCGDADQCECLTQALEYATLYPAKRELLENFWPYAYKKLNTSVGLAFFDQLYARKSELYAPSRDSVQALVAVGYAKAQNG